MLVRNRGNYCNRVNINLIDVTGLNYMSCLHLLSKDCDAILFVNILFFHFFVDDQFNSGFPRLLESP